MSTWENLGLMLDVERFGASIIELHDRTTNTPIIAEAVNIDDVAHFRPVTMTPTGNVQNGELVGVEVSVNEPVLYEVGRYQWRRISHDSFWGIVMKLAKSEAQK